jgi:hypothetical protein
LPSLIFALGCLSMPSVERKKNGLNTRRHSDASFSCDLRHRYDKNVREAIAQLAHRVRLSLVRILETIDA